MDLLLYKMLFNSLIQKNIESYFPEDFFDIHHKIQKYSIDYLAKNLLTNVMN